MIQCGRKSEKNSNVPLRFGFAYLLFLICLLLGVKDLVLHRKLSINRSPAHQGINVVLPTEVNRLTELLPRQQ